MSKTNTVKLNNKRFKVRILFEQTPYIYKMKILLIYFKVKKLINLAAFIHTWGIYFIILPRFILYFKVYATAGIYLKDYSPLGRHF